MAKNMVGCNRNGGDLMTFDVWWLRLIKLAKDNKWKLGDKQTYREYFDDGDSPEDALKSEMRSK